MDNTANVQDDGISLKELILKIREWYRYMLTKWKIILVAGFVGGILGFSYAFFKKPVYIASCTFVLDEGKSGGLGQYAGLAAMAGIDIGGGSNGLFQGENIMELYKSRTMLRKTLLSYAEFDGKKDLLINRYITINKLREKWAKSENPKLQNLSFTNPAAELTRIQDSVITALVANINKRYLTVSKLDKRLSIIKVDVKAGDEQFAKNFNNAVVATVNNFYIETRTKKSVENIKILRHQADSVRRSLDVSMGGVAAAVDANPNANSALQILRVASQRKQVDVQANTAIYSEIVKNLEMAKLSALQDAPLIQVVDAPVFPLSKNVISKFLAAGIGSIIIVFLTVGWMSFRRLLDKIVIS